MSDPDVPMDAPAARPSPPVAAAAPPAPPLPVAQHLERLPRDVTPQQLQRIRQHAYALPQVIAAGDDGGERGPAADARLDALGLVMLQKAVSGARPSRWIAPADIAPALDHLKAVGSGPEARPLMVQRTAALDAQGVRRRGAEWSRLVRHTLTLDEPGWQVPVLYRVTVAPEAVWAWYRDGDAEALQRALGAPPQHPEAASLSAHLNALLMRSREGHPAHLASLLPRLQAECATPQSADELRAAVSRAQDRWEQQAAELDALAGLNDELAFRGYPDTFDLARRMQRSVTLYVGPPNSGKTHAAFERLSQAHDGAYLAPLRLLALEGRDRLVARGVPCSLLTGEERMLVDDARVVSSTIEMLATQRPVDVAVIDEAQMLFDPARGWAWTQAIVAVPANELIIICSAYAVPAIQTLLGLCGERCSVRSFERKQHVQWLPKPVPHEDLRLGDAIVAFSRRDVLTLRDRIAASGHPVAVIYGALPPEVRRREAERYAQGEAHILVATDAIGMGLNLPIRRVLFSTLTKFDGQGDRRLDPSEVHQIAGRAGRYGLHEEGFAGVTEDAEPGAARLLRELLDEPARAPQDYKAPVAPNGWHLETIAARLHKTRLREVLGVFVEQLALEDGHFAVADLEQMLSLAEAIDRVAGRLPLKQRFTYAQAPVDTRTETLLFAFLDWAANHAATGQAGRPTFLDEVDSHSRLDRMEQALKACTVWLWLDLRFPGAYGHADEVQDLRARLNDGIERQLGGQRPLAWMPRRQGGRRGPR